MPVRQFTYSLKCLRQPVHLSFFCFTFSFFIQVQIMPYSVSVTICLTLYQSQSAQLCISRNLSKLCQSQLPYFVSVTISLKSVPVTICFALYQSQSALLLSVTIFLNSVGHNCFTSCQSQFAPLCQ